MRSLRFKIPRPLTVSPFACLILTAAMAACAPPNLGTESESAANQTAGDSMHNGSSNDPHSGANGNTADDGSGNGLAGASSPSNTNPNGGGGVPAAAPGSGSKRVIGYYTAWSVYGRNFQVSDIPADKLTHINYGFANISSDGQCVLGDAYADTDKAYPGDSFDTGVLRGSFHQLQLLKAKKPALRTLISIGGWTWSAQYPTVAATDASRVKFAASCVAFMKQYGFDGIDIDWEYPVSGGLNPGQPADKQNYTLLLTELRKQLTAAGGGLLTIAAPASPKIAANIELEDVGAIVDWINLMSYDFHGAWDTTTNFNAPLFSRPNENLSVDSAVTTYLAANVPADKVVVGMPLYGRAFAAVSSGAMNGLDQPFSGVPAGSWEPGVFDFKDLQARFVGKATRQWDPVAKVPWLFDAATSTFISYDDAESIGLKGQYIFDHGLGGGMFWELSEDDASASLIDVLRSKL